MSSPPHGTHPELTVAIALAAGVLMQSLARHLRIPGIVLLLLAGVLLGPDVLGVVDPGPIEGVVHGLVSFAVAVILFEGGMNMNLGRLRREARVIRLLISVGALVTGIGGTLVAKLILGWDWQLSILFGTLVIVTGPTVITPLLRRIKVRQNVETILEAEGVFIDAVGAIIAVVTLQIALQPTGSTFASGLLGVVGRLALGAGLGLAGGALIVLLLRPRRIVPEGLENIFVLGMVLLLFQVSHAIMPESGIGTVTVAGVVMGNVRSRVSREVLEFKEQLTAMFIGLLFVLLAANVRLADVQALGMQGIYAVLALMLLVRPLNILASTAGSTLTWREKAFLGWLAPRGIVAAAVASLFAQALRDEGVPGGDPLRSMVFLVIAVTVLVQGLTGGWVAKWLGLRRPVDQGYAILGASDLGRVLGRALAGEDRSRVVFLDSNADASHAAEAEGFRVIYGNALEESSMARAQMDTRYACVAVTTNEEVNLLFARRAIEEFKLGRLFVGLQKSHGSVTPEMVYAVGAQVLFGRERDLALWDVRFRRGLAPVETWDLVSPPKRIEGEPRVEAAEAATTGMKTGGGEAGTERERELAGAASATTGSMVVATQEATVVASPGSSLAAADLPEVEEPSTRPGSANKGEHGESGFVGFPDALLPLAIRRGSRRVPVDARTNPKKGDRVWFAIFSERRENAARWLAARGWEPVAREDSSTHRDEE